MLKKLGVFKDFTDGSIKSVFDAENNKIIEMTLLFNKEDKDVVCAPTHHFCNLGCKMCHLTNKGLNKKMLPIIIDDFIEALITTITEEKNNKRIKRTNKNKLLISFMGVGEPLLNLKLIEEVYRNEDIIKKLGYDDISYALSTMMPNDNLLLLTDLVNKLNIPLKVHFSLHTPIDEERFNLLPGTKVSIDNALNYLNNYRNVIVKNEIIMANYNKFHRTNDLIEIHYTLIKGVNDSDNHLEKLCELLNKYRITIKFIRFNPINEMEVSDKESLWVSNINSKVPNLRVKTYSPPGREIGSSCGEFTKHYYHEEIETEKELEEFKTWQTKHRIE